MCLSRVSFNMFVETNSVCGINDSKTVNKAKPVNYSSLITSSIEPNRLNNLLAIEHIINYVRTTCVH